MAQAHLQMLLLQVLATYYDDEQRKRPDNGNHEHRGREQGVGPRVGRRLIQLVERTRCARDDVRISSQHRIQQRVDVLFQKTSHLFGARRSGKLDKPILAKSELLVLLGQTLRRRSINAMTLGNDGQPLAQLAVDLLEFRSHAVHRFVRSREREPVVQRAQLHEQGFRTASRHRHSVGTLLQSFGLGADLVHIHMKHAVKAHEQRGDHGHGHAENGI